MGLGVRLSLVAFFAVGCLLACGADDEEAGDGGAGEESGGTGAGTATGGSGAMGGSATGGVGASGGTGATSGSGATSGGGATSSGGSGGSGAMGGSGGMSGSGATSGGAAAGGGGSGAAGGSGTAGSAGGGAMLTGLSWPIDCIPNETCLDLGYPDIDDDGMAFDCSEPGYMGHEGTDIPITQARMDAGTAVRAAADGTVWFASDGKYDRCPNDDEPDCQNPPGYEAGAMTGTTVCTELGPYCNDGRNGQCFWCFAGGNVIVVLHDASSGAPGVFATRYDHLKRDSVLVAPGERVTRGQKIAEVGSAGNSTGPHLHFEVWSTSYYVLAEPWAGSCGPNQGPSLWANDPPWE